MVVSLVEMVAQPLRLATLISAGLAVALTSFPLAVSAQANPRSTFPGRRVGGGTRGECSARTLVHLVPATHTTARKRTAWIGLCRYSKREAR